MVQHRSVLLKEVLEVLNPKEGEFFIDGTLDGGGHAQAILEKLDERGILLGIDLDAAMTNVFIAKRQGQSAGPKVVAINGNYADTPQIIKEQKLPKADGFLLDLGFSSEQLESGHGFSFLKDEPLDMRYSVTGDTYQTAAEVIHSIREDALAEIIAGYGEERYARKIANAIVIARRKKKIITTYDLVSVIKAALPKNYERGRIHPATRTFQALRIYVNNEVKNLGAVLNVLPDIMKSGGRDAIISFHSLEDRLVKNAFRDLAKTHYRYRRRNSIKSTIKISKIKSN